MSSELIDKDKSYEAFLYWLYKNPIIGGRGLFFTTVHGSHAYGTNTETSDWDFKGIAIPPLEYYFGILNNFEQAELKKPIDAVVYQLQKFVELASKCNPNIIEMLFTDQTDWVKWDIRWEQLHEKRNLFLSQKARYSFSGYAFSQLQRIETHRRWLINPPKKQPVREDFGLKSGQGILTKEELDVINSKIRKVSDQLAGEKGYTRDKLETEEVEQTLIDDAITQLDYHKSLIPVVMAERRYNAACKNWSQYQTWLRERNKARSELEAKFGYDTKHAMHLVRLMRMSEEILSEGKVIVKRPDAEELLAIRNGAWKIDDLIEWARNKEKSVMNMETKLPHSPDRIAINELVMNIMKDFYHVV